MGKCPSCNAWNSLKEFHEAKLNTKKDVSTGINLVTTPAKESSLSKQTKFSSHIHEVDRVLQEGFFPGSVILFGGHPGVGKSTLSMQIFLQQENTLYFSGEESVHQVSDRAGRLDTKKEKKKNVENSIFATNSLEDILATLSQQRPKLAIIDSIQMIGLQNASFGTMQTIRENAELLVKTAKSIGTTLIIIGHVTKSDEIAGPKVLEHLVDVVLYLEGERETGVRILRASKNRFGSTLEVGIFSMNETGLQELNNPSQFFLDQRPQNASGNCITVVREGTRNFLMELQALTVKTNFGLPRRTTHGVDIAKIHLLLAVLSKFTAFPADTLDTYINVVGGLKIKDTSLDLALCAALISSRSDTPLDPQTIILGEVGLSGEIRQVGHLQSRLQEAERLGFTRAIIPNTKETLKLESMKVSKVKHVGEFMKLIT